MSGLGSDLPLDDRRQRQVRRALGVCGALAVAGAVIVAVLGAGPRSTLGAGFLGLALAFGVASLVGVTTALVDEWHGHRVRRRRVIVAVAHLVAVPICLVLAAGAVGAEG